MTAPKSMALLGDDAVAMGAIHSGIAGSYAYPGTPATEIQEAVQKYVQAFPDCGINAAWSINEKVAMEEAVGVSMIGRRALVNMKHVGLNVAADPFMNAAVTGCAGGVVIAVADDPSMHSSQNEQDSRYFADFAQIPCFEPANQQEAYDMTRAAFELSERMETPVMMRLSTRISHTRARVTFSEAVAAKPARIPGDFNRWTLLPTNARPQYEKLLAKQGKFVDASESGGFNKLSITKGAKLGVIASGLGFNYFMENLNEGGVECSWLKVSQYPLPAKQIDELIRASEEILVIEEGYPFVERNLPSYLARAGKLIPIRGKLTGALPRSGELTADCVRKALGQPERPSHGPAPAELVRPRPPALCKGCPHCDTFNAINEAMKGKENERLVFSDIGCYTLGFYEPFKSIHSCLCMGASVSMAKAAGENGLKYALAIIGDSTFNHSGITPLVEGIQRKTPFVAVILDNATTAMTGGQETLVIGEPLDRMILGMGLDPAHLRVINPIPKNHEENTRIIREEAEYRGPSVVIARRACLQAKA